MSTLADFQIRDLCRSTGLVEPFDADLVNPASIDVTLGSSILVERTNTSGFQPWSLLNDDGTELDYLLSPGEFILAHTFETVRVPNDLEATFHLKSSRGREGFNHLMAGYIDPGFSGVITLELHNVTRNQTLRVSHRLRIGQLRFSRLDAKPLRGYQVTGRYNNARTVEESKG